MDRYVTWIRIWLNHDPQGLGWDYDMGVKRFCGNLKGKKKILLKSSEEQQGQCHLGERCCLWVYV